MRLQTRQERNSTQKSTNSQTTRPLMPPPTNHPAVPPKNNSGWMPAKKTTAGFGIDRFSTVYDWIIANADTHPQSRIRPPPYTNTPTHLHPHLQAPLHHTPTRAHACTQTKHSTTQRNAPQHNTTQRSTANTSEGLTPACRITAWISAVWLAARGAVRLAERPSWLSPAPRSTAQPAAGSVVGRRRSTAATLPSPRP